MPTYTILQRYLYRQNKTWYGRINDGGEIKYISLKTKRKADAQAWLDAMNAARFIPENLLNDGFKRLPKIDIFKASMDFIEDVEATTPKSAEHYKNVIDMFLDHCEKTGIKFLNDFSIEQAQKYVNDLTQYTKPQTIKNKVSVVSLFLKRSYRKKGLQFKNPFEDVSLPRIEKREKDFWTNEQIELILDHAPQKFRIGWAFMAYAGFRVHEAAKVSSADFRGDDVIIVYGKGGKEVRLPISERLRNEIELYKRENGGAFITPKFERSWSNKALKMACDSAGVERGNWCSNHKLRHSYISNLARAEIGAKQLQQLARHANASTTLEVYSHVLPADLKKAVNKKIEAENEE